MLAFPGCKINLGLHILRKRSDGFHDIDTVFYPVVWSDALEILPSSEFAFSFSGLTIQGSSEENLCLKAYRLLAKDFSLPHIHGHLHKVVPMGAGLGGGSADAAHTLRLLNSIAALNLSVETLSAYARQLGSDCSFFLMDTAARGTGRGEILEPLTLTLKGCFLVMVVPPIHVSTADAYAKVTPQAPKEELSRTLARPLAEWRQFMVNDFESSVFARHPELALLKSRLYDMGAVYASMSGSGCAVFGIFNKEVSWESELPGLTAWSGWL